MFSIIRTVKFNNYLPLLNQKYLISTSENVDQMKIIKQQNENVLKTKINQHQKFKNTVRTLTTFNHSGPIEPHTTGASKTEEHEFREVFPDLVRDLTELLNKYDSKVVPEWFAKALQYNVPKGNQIRSQIIVSTYKLLVNKNELTPENLRLTQILIWCFEMIKSALFITDDIMDQSILRRGQPCWHKLENVGLTAVNDSLMIENAAYYILKKYFSQKSYYVSLLEIFRKVFLIETIGQSLDMRVANKNVTEFTLETFRTIATLKTTNFAFYMPFTLPMIMAGLRHQEVFRQAEPILLKMGEFYQMQNDFIDCFGDPAVSGTIGTDIQNNKCTWLAIDCMQRANEEQKNIMIECYGKNDPDKVDRVKDLYLELGLPDIYAQYEEDFHNTTKTLIEQTKIDVPHEILYKMLGTCTLQKT